MPSSTDNSHASLNANYTSPTDANNFQYLIAYPPTNPNGDIETKAKTVYLHELRVSTKKLQEDINIFLTNKMEADKKAGADTTKGKTQEELDEENYGDAPAGEDDDDIG